MRKRFRPNQRRTKKNFTRTARKTHKKNVVAGPMRGGIRL